MKRTSHGSEKGQKSISAFFASKTSRSKREKSAPGAAELITTGDRQGLNPGNASSRVTDLTTCEESVTGNGNVDIVVPSVASEMPAQKRAKHVNTPAIPPRNTERHNKAQRKFSRKWECKSPSDAKSQRGNVKYTPLEQQVMDLKRKHADMVLFVEVRYCNNGTGQYQLSTFYYIS
jgi:hypothetical protein